MGHKNLLPAMDQSFSVYFRLVQAWEFDEVCMQLKPTYIRLCPSGFYKNMGYMLISHVTKGCEYSAKLVCTVTLLNVHHTYCMHQ